MESELRWGHCAAGETEGVKERGNGWESRSQKRQEEAESVANLEGLALNQGRAPSFLETQKEESLGCPSSLRSKPVSSRGPLLFLSESQTYPNPAD